MLVLDNIFRLFLGSFSLDVCIVICCNDFLLVIYKVGIEVESWYIVCSNKVDLFVFGLLLISIVVFGMILLFNMWLSFLKLLENWGIFCKFMLESICICDLDIVSV